MSKLLKKWWVWVGLAVIIVVAVFLVMNVRAAGNNRAAVQSAQVSRGDLQSTVLSSAALQPAADLTLTFGSSSTLTDLKVKAGDTVMKGQVLAQIDASDLNLAVTQAQANLASAQAKLDSTKAGSSAKDIANAESALQSAQAKLDNLKAGPTKDDIASAEASLRSAQAKLNTVK